MNTTSTPAIGICGGGNLAHAMAGWLGTRGLHVNILTRNPNQWGKSLSTIFPNGTTHHAPLGHISNHPEILKDCNLVLVAVPRFGIREVCHRIKPYLHREQGLAIVPGTPEVMEMAEDPSWTSSVSLMGIYKVPLICRTQEYGHSVSILGSRPLNRIWVAPGNNAEHWSAMLETLFDTPLTHLSSPWPFLLTNSNPLLHPSRCMSLFRHYREGMFYDKQFLFYEEWTEEASELYIQADRELLTLCSCCPGMEIGKDIIPVLDYYESRNAVELTKKIQSIPAFHGVKAPMTRRKQGWIPDFSSRYFTEDVPLGTKPICCLAEQLNIPVPTLQSFVEWNTSILNRFSPFQKKQ
ncbi:NAD/NADP octopine/nopaline dehydrogenase family protein [Akkermansia muciniphila]|jgi:opine dehydrogenase|uniref:NAD/NADP octopine/nopaline dehydrogenase family protein n=1 Tax=Akkermansia muciniphila TaxID=239935 RepID=UPI001C060CCB|nr:NAD/NADP-dependent octopine/nopaline dehydrogenase family protein [Akkermansia muciniphila]QWP04905.1 NAD/NADP octopine/nopaline dehydrogenase family protein [Akkermansia muciniphila]QWP24931.1 NAD/NADP octopine/nopaline dehydrogenase family protein [Akkermansia muciniphila]QWP28700.1 NAD/NADP octopine/nopaline dehydrogenase family protein [Akkermansia muciniphila]